MALTLTRAAGAQRTTTGQTTAVSLAAGYRKSLYIKHVNPSGSVTAGTARVQVRTSGGTDWFTLLAIAFGTTASATETRVVPLPDDAAEVRLDYTAASGTGSPALDHEVGLVTAY